jgi:acetyl-CoA carboxylase biotin carboxyl carrier protein
MMDGSKNPQQGHSPLSRNGDITPEMVGKSMSSPVSIDHLKRLVQLLDQTDVAELELTRPDEGTRLVLRKMKTAETNGLQGEVAPAVISAVGQGSQEPMTAPKHYIQAHLVGTFHTWGKPRGGSLIAVGDQVKVGQLVGTIESLNVINEVESSIAGRVVEILVQEGQPVEYGQHLIVLESVPEETEHDVVF